MDDERLNTPRRRSEITDSEWELYDWHDVTTFEDLARSPDPVYVAGMRKRIEDLPPVRDRRKTWGGMS